MSRRWFTGPFAMIPRCFLAANLTPRALKVVAAISSHADAKSGECKVSATTIAAEIKIHLRHVRRAMRCLEIQGLLERTERSGHSSEYRLSNPWPNQPRVPRAKTALPTPGQNGQQGEGQNSQGGPGQNGPPHYVEQIFNRPQQQTDGVVVADFSPRNDELVALLLHVGVSVAVAHDLVREHPDRVREQADWLPSRRRVNDRAAFLVRAIREDFARPTNYRKPPEYVDLAKLYADEFPPDPEPGSEEYEANERAQAERRRLVDDALARWKGLST
jgi:hypothetical protein